MKSDQEVIDRSLARYRNPSTEQVESAVARVWQDLEADAVSEDVLQDLQPIRQSPGIAQPLWFAAAATVVLAIILSAVFWPRAPYAVAVSGALQRVSGETSEAIQPGGRIAFGEVLRSDGESGAVLTLVDRSRIEMRSRSEILLESAGDGVRIRLNRGSVIVTATEQRFGHLYVQTKDVIVSVVGTVFLVNAEEEGSRVVVIEGEVRVRQGGVEKKLLPGEQVVTGASMASLPVGEGISWSRNAESHLALLQQYVVALPQAPSKRLEFEVAAIKPSGPDSPALSISSSTGRLVTSNTSLKMLVTWAYDISNDRLIGAPDWLDSARYDILAKVPAKEPGEDPGRERLKLMMQSLLAERFKLVFHRETRELSMYALATDGKGLKVHLRDAGNDLGRNAFSMPGSGRLVGTKVTPRMLAKVLSEQLHREVEDRTGLQGIFDFTLEWAPDSDAANASGRPSIFTAIREQLGLELVAHKGPVEVLVIDKIERSPISN